MDRSPGGRVLNPRPAHRRCRPRWQALAGLALAWLLASGPALAGTLSRQQLSALLPASLMAGERDPELPVWPLFRNELTSAVLAGYAFESIDLAPVPGYSGTPFNLLVILDDKGRFVDVRVLSHHEPVFLDGLGPAPLLRFVEQYRGLSLLQPIRVGSGAARSAGGAGATLDGVAKATASIRIVNQSLLSAALAVARARLGFAAGRDPGQLGRIRAELFQPMDFDALAQAGLLGRKAWRQREIEAAFQGSAAEGLDRHALQQPEALFTELLVAQLDVPMVGRNLLEPRDGQRLAGRLEDGDHAFLVATRGPYSPIGGDDDIAGAVPLRLTLRQGGLPIEIRDLDIEVRPRLPAEWLGDGARWRIYRVIRQAGLDPAQPLELALGVVRSKGQILAERVRRDFALTLQLPPAYVELPRGPAPAWHGLWRDRAAELGLLLAALAGLALMLARPGWLTRDHRRLARLRLAWMLGTLVLLGWLGQGQLSIVNLTAAIQALVAGRSLGFFLQDPMTVLLWGFVALSLVLWGRGSFCGWLCPFGALQEAVSWLARRLRVPQWRPHLRTDARLKRIKYGLLAALVATPVFSAGWTDRLVEVEPFKTSITLLFQRSWPHVAWALALLALGAVVYKAYCRYLCPLGAALAVMGRVRRFDWLARRAECGQPCQTCRHRCEYQAIDARGAIDYDECFQCLDCVAIHDSDQLCAPRILARRKGRTIPVHALPSTPLRRPA